MGVSGSAILQRAGIKIGRHFTASKCTAHAALACMCSCVLGPFATACKFRDRIIAIWDSTVLAVSRRGYINFKSRLSDVTNGNGAAIERRWGQTTEFFGLDLVDLRAIDVVILLARAASKKCASTHEPWFSALFTEMFNSAADLLQCTSFYRGGLRVSTEAPPGARLRFTFRNSSLTRTPTDKRHQELVMCCRQVANCISHSSCFF